MPIDAAADLQVSAAAPEEELRGIRAIWYVFDNNGGTCNGDEVEPLHHIDGKLRSRTLDGVGAAAGIECTCRYHEGATKHRIGRTSIDHRCHHKLHDVNAAARIAGICSCCGDTTKLCIGRMTCGHPQWNRVP